MAENENAQPNETADAPEPEAETSETTEATDATDAEAKASSGKAETPQQNRKKKIVEALILAAPEPISPQKLAQIVPHLKPSGVKAIVAELNQEYEEQDRAFEVWEVAGGYQIRTRPEFSGYLRQLQTERPVRLSRAALSMICAVTSSTSLLIISILTLVFCVNISATGFMFSAAPSGYERRNVMSRPCANLRT